MTINKVKYYRLKSKLRQLDLARMIGISENLLSKIETDRINPKPELLQKLSEALNISIKKLAGTPFI